MGDNYFNDRFSIEGDFYNKTDKFPMIKDKFGLEER